MLTEQFQPPGLVESFFNDQKSVPLKMAKVLPSALFWFQRIFWSSTQSL